MPDSSDFSCDAGTFFACDYGSEFLGCCLNNQQSEVCQNGCEVEKVQTAYISQEYESYLSSGGVGRCYDGYEWQTCDYSRDSTAAFGCYLSGRDPCGMSSTTALGNATIPSGSEDNDPYPLVSDPRLGTQSTVTATPTSQATVTTTQSATTDSPDGKIGTGVIAGSAAGGTAAVAMLMGFLIWFCCRRKRRETRSNDLTAMHPAENYKSVIPVPAYSATDPNSAAKQPVQASIALRDIATSDPSRPCSELSSYSPASPPVSTMPTRLHREGLVPDSQIPKQAESINLTNSSGAFPYAHPGAAYLGRVN